MEWITGILEWKIIKVYYELNSVHNRNNLHVGPNRSDLHLYILVYDNTSYYSIVTAVLNG